MRQSARRGRAGHRFGQSDFAKWIRLNGRVEYTLHDEFAVLVAFSEPLSGNGTAACNQLGAIQIVNATASESRPSVRTYPNRSDPNGFFTPGC